MTLPQPVQDAVKRLDYTVVPITDGGNLKAWQVIRAELHRLSEIAATVDPLVIRLGEVTTRLEVANALLRGVVLKHTGDDAEGCGMSDDDISAIQFHLQGAGDEA